MKAMKAITASTARKVIEAQRRAEAEWMEPNATPAPPYPLLLKSEGYLECLEKGPEVRELVEAAVAFTDQHDMENVGDPDDGYFPVCLKTCRACRINNAVMSLKHFTPEPKGESR